MHQVQTLILFYQIIKILISSFQLNNEENISALFSTRTLHFRISAFTLDENNNGDENNDGNENNNDDENNDSNYFNEDNEDKYNMN
jgi:hypothetical protein